jgi:hypothetical protein
MRRAHWLLKATAWIVWLVFLIPALVFLAYVVLLYLNRNIRY